MNPVLFVYGFGAISFLVAILCARRRAARLAGRPVGPFMPVDAPGPGWTCRITEALVLAAAAVPILLMTATNRSTGGLLLRLDEFQPAYARINVIVFACAAAGVTVGVLVALFRRTWAATVLVAATLCTYGLALNGTSRPCEWFASPEVREPPVKYAIRVRAMNVAGANLWVNGVHLGKTPVTMTLDEFLAKVPFWPEPPQDYETDKVHIPEHEPRTTFIRDRKRWIEFTAPRKPDWSSRLRPHVAISRSRADDKRERTYYARVKYGGEWGLAGSTRGFFHFAVVFPEREKRLDGLLDKARLADYRVDAAWFEAMETYDEDGWVALRKAGDDEPQMMRILDDWATWRYGLDTVSDAESAWRVFQDICREADERQQYLTPSVAGRAVELLVPMLPGERLVNEAERLIRSVRTYTWHDWRMNGRYQFGFSQRPERVDLGVDRVSGGSSGGRVGSRTLPMSGFAVAHAVWMLNDLMVSRGDPQPNLVQRRIVPALIRWHYDDGLPTLMLAAGHFGGPAVGRFLLRQDWRRDVRLAGSSRHENRLSVGAAREVNKWLYLLANLNDEAGSEFRRKDPGSVMHLADEVILDPMGRLDSDMRFIFLDDALAIGYWPQFSHLVGEKSREFALETRWRYLHRMGAAATPAMYVDAWEATSGVSAANDGFRVIDLLEPEKRRAVVTALIAHVQQDDSNLKDESRAPSRERARDQVISELRAHLAGIPLSRAQRLLGELKEYSDEDLPRHVGLWLEHTEPDSPLVEMLAEAEDPALRLMVMGALKQHPTPANRAILAKLLQDPDETVRTAAEEVHARLEELASRPPADLVSQSDGA